MSRLLALLVCTATLLVLAPSLAIGQIHAMVNYETKSAESWKSLKKPISAPARKEGNAIIHVEPQSKTIGPFSTTGIKARPTSPRSEKASCA